MPDFSALAELSEGLSGGVGFSVEEWFASDEDDSAVCADMVLVETESLAQDAFEAVADDGAAESPARCEAHAAHFLRATVTIIKDMKDKVSVGYGITFVVHFLEIFKYCVSAQFKHDVLQIRKKVTKV